MAKSLKTGVRIGPISLLTLISVLLLAVLAMLCVTTTNAASAMSERQAENVSDTYALDSCGQKVLACIDEKLQSGAGTSASFAASTVTAGWNTIQQKVVAAGYADGLDISASSDGNTISFDISTDAGKTLSAKVRVSDNMTYTVEEWKTTTTQETPQETLWTGATTK